MRSLKTPLRYPGGKSRAITKMARYLPDMKKYKEYKEKYMFLLIVALFILFLMFFLIFIKQI